ncbi:MAG: TonB-dependent siderophore receptor [Reyranella sp.]|uniref:TonB-dependent receptor n=1 Tax=Reyranella sp. TaxID=1929291 RepID=UPI00120DA275|nr:TonB-dependent receptor [Reyranella sp.]TAJ97397.1 MAG: TonB-dependent siderophore receptor [Reyranella sp.]TBR25216.1 MAG: TonB-dependent siderophore receptor [Reyranella sp.]
MFARITVAAVAAGSLMAGDVLAQGVAAGGPQQAQAGRPATFNVPSQPLAQALTAFGQQAGVQIVVNNSAVAGKTSTAIGGSMTAEHALQLLLAGTGVTFRFTSANTVTISGVPDAGGALQLDPVQVQGAFIVPPQAMIDNAPPVYAGGQVATGGQLGLLGNRAVMDTPFNQSNYTAKKAQDQQAKTVRDVLIDDPSVRITRGDNSPGTDQVKIRGFPVDNSDTSYGGLYGMLPNSSIMAEMAERVEVLKGPSALLNGIPPFGSIGGNVNVVPKRAPNEDLTQATASYISGSQFGGHIDFGRRFGEDKEFGVRFNGVFRGGQTDIQYNADQRALAVLGFDVRGERVRLSADLGYQNQYISGITPYLTLAPGVQLPYAPSARSNPTAQPWGFQGRKDAFGVFRLEMDITDNVTLYASAGAHDYRMGGLYSAATTITNFNGAGTALAPLNFSQYTTSLTAQGGLRALFSTADVNHELALTASTLQQDNGQVNVSQPGGAFATNIYNSTLIARPNIPTPAANKTSTSGFNSIGIADTIFSLNNRVQLTAGLRAQNVQSANFNAVTGALTASYDQTVVSPAVALIVKPLENVSLYGNYIQGLQQGTVVQVPFANAGTILPPYVSNQIEVGVKVDWGTFTTTAALFQITQPSVITNTATNTQSVNGQQVNQGLELNMFGEPAKGFRLLGGAMFLNPVLAKTQGGAADGWIAPFTPQFTLNLSGEVDLPFVPGLTLAGRAIYTGPQYIDTTYPRRMMPQWTRFDLGARYTFENPGAKGKMLVARFDVDNILDANYWAGSNQTATFMFLGAPRTFRLSLTADF